MSGPFFEGIKQWNLEQEGVHFKLPVFYPDATSITATYTAATEKVKSLLPHRDMRLVELRPGKCLVVITCFEYRTTDIGAYNEVAISFPITFKARQIPGWTVAVQSMRREMSIYVWQLPVTTEIARKGGVDLYGYPKFLADIDFKRDDEVIRCSLEEDGEKILALEGKVLTTEPGKTMRLRSYSVLGETPIRANVLQNPVALAESREANAAWLELGSNHSIAEELRNLELSLTPVSYRYCPVLEVILFPGRNLVDD